MKCDGVVMDGIWWSNGLQINQILTPGKHNNLLLSLHIPRVNVMTGHTASTSHRQCKQEANFACTVPGCGSMFTQGFNLKGHLHSHFEEKPYKCHWPGCGKGFVRQHDCKRHEQLHNDFRPFECEVPLAWQHPVTWNCRGEFYVRVISPNRPFPPFPVSANPHSISDQELISWKNSQECKKMPGVEIQKLVTNRVVHGSHYWVIFNSFLTSFLDPFWLPWNTPKCKYFENKAKMHFTLSSAVLASTHTFKLHLKGLSEIIFSSLSESKYLINVIFNLNFNRVVHGWHFLVIFHSIFQSFSWFPLFFFTFFFHS